MEELRNLALQLGKMGLSKVTLEADLNKFLELKKSVQEYMATASPVSKQYDEINGGLEFFIALYGVKMLIVCRNARLETSRVEVPDVKIGIEAVEVKLGNP